MFSQQTNALNTVTRRISHRGSNCLKCTSHDPWGKQNKPQLCARLCQQAKTTSSSTTSLGDSNWSLQLQKKRKSWNSWNSGLKAKYRSWHSRSRTGLCLSRISGRRASTELHLLFLLEAAWIQPLEILLVKPFRALKKPAMFKWFMEKKSTSSHYSLWIS